MRRFLAALTLTVCAWCEADVPAVQHYDEALLSKPTYKVKVEMNVQVPMRDGITVSTDIYRPDAEGKFPAILYRSPYSNNTDAAIATSKWFAERGYVYMYQDVRGKFDSKGEFYPFRHEPNDGYDMDEWIGQQPWFSGKLGTMGGSYSGYTQWGQAIRGSKYLAALAPQFTTPDIQGNWLYVDGALNYAFALSWGAIMIDGQVSQSTGNAIDMAATYRTLPIVAAPMTAGHRAPHYHDWLAHPTRDEYWDDISFETAYDKIEVPMLSVGGWYDIFLRGTLQDDVEVRAKGKPSARAGKRLMIGPWIHGASTRNNAYLGPARPDAVDFGAAADVDLQKLYLRWFDYWLKGIENGAKDEPPVKIFVMGDNVWRYEQEWPLKRARPTKYYLSSLGRANTLDGNGTLSTKMPTGKSAPTDTYVYDPNDPVPTTGGTSCCAALTSVGPMDQRPVEKRQDVLVFTTEPLTEAIEVTGPVTLKLYASTTAKDTDWAAKLVDVAPDGYARNVQEGILRARYRETRGRAPGTLLQPGKVYEYTIDLWSASNAFLPGHRIRLEVSSSNFPHFDRNLNTGEDTATSSRIEVATQTVHHSAQYPSHVVLPIIPRAAASAPRSRQAAASPIPNLAGQVMTVNGPIAGDRLGQTLMHEHVFIDFTVPDDEPDRWRIAGRTKPVEGEALRTYEAPLTMDILSAVLFGAPNRDNWRLDDEKTAIKEVADFKRHGGGTIVDVSSIGLKRNPTGLRRVGEATGVNIVMGTSWYTQAWYAKELERRTVEDLTSEIVRDVTVGVDGTGIRAGIIGEVGTSADPASPIENKIIRASGRASRLTGAAVTLHTLGFFKKHAMVLDMLAAEGADLTRVILGHSDFLANDTVYLIPLLQRGATVQFDLIGKSALLTRTRAPDPEVAKTIVELIKAGYADRLLLSHDICTKTSLKAYGGTGYAFILERFVPYLKSRGVTDAQLATILIDNPRRLLTLVAPRVS